MLALISFFISFVIYFIPTIVAIYKDKPNTTAIFILNLCLGWTFLGWVASLIWAVVD